METILKLIASLEKLETTLFLIASLEILFYVSLLFSLGYFVYNRCSSQVKAFIVIFCAVGYRVIHHTFWKFCIKWSLLLPPCIMLHTMMNEKQAIKFKQSCNIQNIAHLQHWKEAVNYVESLANIDNVLDFGYGTGRTSEMMRNILGQEVNITGVDVYKAKSQFEANKLNVHFHLYDGDKLPFATDFFDISIARWVLHHIIDNENSVKELLRVSKYVIIQEEIIWRGSWQEIGNKLNDDWSNMCATFSEEGDLSWLVYPPNSNREDEEWLKLFQQLGADILFNKFAIIDSNQLFVLTPEEAFEATDIVNAPSVNVFYVLTKIK